MSHLMCVICQDPFTSDKIIKSLSCEHTFHDQCSQSIDDICPVPDCKKSLKKLDQPDSPTSELRGLMGASFVIKDEMEEEQPRQRRHRRIVDDEAVEDNSLDNIDSDEEQPRRNTSMIERKPDSSLSTISLKEEPELEELTENGKPRCQCITTRGEQCKRKAKYDDMCIVHYMQEVEREDKLKAQAIRNKKLQINEINEARRRAGARLEREVELVKKMKKTLETVDTLVSNVKSSATAQDSFLDDWLGKMAPQINSRKTAKR